VPVRAVVDRAVAEHAGAGHVHFHHDHSSPMPGSSDSRKMTLPWALLLLGSGYFLFVAGPLLTSRFAALRWVRDLVSGHAWVPAPAAAGTALLGAAALIFVVARLVRDVEQRPYASIAPVLAVFSGLVLTSTRTDLPLPNVGAPQLGILVLALGLLGGVLIGRDSVTERALGWALAVAPSIALFLVLTAAMHKSDPLTMLRSADSSLRTYLMLLSVSSLSLGLVGSVARNLVRRPEFGSHSEGLRSSGSFDGEHVSMPRLHSTGGFGEPMRLPRPQPMQPQVTYQQPGHNLVHTPTLLGQPRPMSRHTPQQAIPVRSLPMRPVGPTGYAQPAQYEYYAPEAQGFTEIADDDPDLQLLTGRRFSIGRVLTALIVISALVAAGLYFFVVRPRQHDADLARVESAAIHPGPVSDLPAPDVQAEESAARLRALLESDGVKVRPAEPKPADVVPPAGAASADEPAPRTALPAEQAIAPVADEAEKVARVHHHAHAHRHRAEKARADESEQDVEARGAREPKQEEAPSKAAPSDKRDVEAKPARVKPEPAVPQNRNERDLDLDSLLNKATKSSNGVNAQEDPILGL